MLKTTAFKFVRSVWSSFKAESGLEPWSLRIINARVGIVSLELQIKKHHTNRLQILHGGTIASMVDLGGSLAVASRGLFATGVSTDLNVTYLSSGGKVGDIIRAQATCDKFGKKLAYTSIIFYNEKREVFARGSHTKYVLAAWKDPRNKTGYTGGHVPDPFAVTICASSSSSLFRRRGGGKRLDNVRR
ncbi:esterase [Saccharata proteae CBS 121410]|uniref:Esterase n=1 Tax=Saccharata proteae CBS 121410 TaxID=1314787 RepID=A0A9P4LWD7_9PEZI|nr:esterase [Saccharata proteae CBS 121410]